MMKILVFPGEWYPVAEVVRDTADVRARDSLVVDLPEQVIAEYERAVEEFQAAEARFMEHAKKAGWGERT